MKKKTVFISLLFLLVMTLCSAMPLSADDSVSYTIDELDISLGLPVDYNYVFTRNMDDDNPILADWGVSLEDIFKSDAVYLEALSEDQNEECIVTMVTNDWSEMNYSFDLLSESELLELSDQLVNITSVDNVTFSGSEIYYGNSQVKFIRSIGDLAGDEVAGKTVQYVTVLNGNAYTFTFNFYDDAFDAEREATVESIMDSVTFGRIVEKDQSDSKLIYIIVIVLMAIIIAVLIYVIRKQNLSLKKMITDVEKADAVEESEENPEIK